MGEEGINIIGLKLCWGGRREWDTAVSYRSDMPIMYGFQVI